MKQFRFRRNRMFCENVAVASIAARAGTPFYLYSQTAIEENYREFERAFSGAPHLICYAVKANSNLAILSLLRRLGAGFDIVSGGELRRVLTAGADAGKVVFSGVGKTEEEIDLALGAGILQFNVESESELGLLNRRAAALRRIACIGLRVNPDVDAETHPYHSTGLGVHKFGVPLHEAAEVLRRAVRLGNLAVRGIGFHIGSQITRMEPFIGALERVAGLCRELRVSGLEIGRLDIGGGLGITYRDEAPPRIAEYGRSLLKLVRDLRCTVVLEPGRAIVGNAGILVTRVLHLKKNGAKRFVIVDAAMNDLIRPSLYGAFHQIEPEHRRGRRTHKVDVVGPVCETGDFLARDREMPEVRPGDLLAVMSSGAYGFVSSSNYNSRPRIAEVLVRKDRFKVVRRREQFEDLIRGESRRSF